ncbi:hypothetical protein C8F04DRAFT_1212338 [Mycena alexandri]|uniref:CxC2-like cysteine cluster KDZ transposase-associated domain-containing protein n=1 Tax=Mycena alexandri TaxID=1745969 RepID=A0AAD6SHY5_9AGAR|nr:hypothetical protein C8F04DRAFT_1212338 [Mycena alexandri]
MQQFFFDETLRNDGLGDALDDKACSCCKNVYPRQSRRFRCSDCSVFVQCLDCVTSRHSLSPLHRLKEWNGTFWTATTVKKLGIVYQLGHGRHPCRRPAPKVHDLVVLDTEGIHTVSYRFWGCDRADRANNLEQLMRNEWYPATTVDPDTCATFRSLETFRILNVVGNINVHDDFVGSMERQTDPSQVDKVPDRYKAFGRMTRGHDSGGLAGTANGQAALLCWPCPHEGKICPRGGATFLYMLLLAMDANFRLKSRLRANEHDDPPLGDEWGYFVEEAPYKEHLRGYVAEKDVSTCIAFAALLQKDTRLTTGLRCSGVGGVVCARHEVVRAQGIGDLQKGERYANMDYILVFAILGITALYLAISYDITCQWQINIRKRLEKMPEHLVIDLSAITLLFALPVWHAAAHEEACQNENSLTYQDGVGRTDGEGIERTGSVLNPISWATKEMTRGARADSMEDKIDHHNWEKNINQGTTLPRKLILAIDERDHQVEAFKEVDKTLTRSIRKQWQKQIDDWKADRTQPNPYLMAKGKDGTFSVFLMCAALTRQQAGPLKPQYAWR